MTRNFLILGIALIGLTLALGSNAWAGHGRNNKSHHDHKIGRHCHNGHHGHHYGWSKGKRHPHRKCYRHHRARRHRDHGRRPVVQEKHIYHHYQRKEPRYIEDSGFKFVFALADEVLGIAVAVSGSD